VDRERFDHEHPFLSWFHSFVYWGGGGGPSWMTRYDEYQRFLTLS